MINSNINLIDQKISLSSKEIKTKLRHLKILPNYINKTFYVHTGKNFTKIKIVKEMVGHKLGEFAKTRKSFKFKKK